MMLKELLKIKYPDWLEVVCDDEVLLAIPNHRKENNDHINLYGDCEVCDISGFDDGLTYSVNVPKEKT